MTIQKFLIENSEVRLRLDKFLVSKLHQYSRNYFQNLIKIGKVKVNGKIIEKDYSLKVGDVIDVDLEEVAEISLEPDSSVRFDVVFDGPDFAVINKPAGLVVHPSSSHKKGTLVNGLLDRWPEIRNVGENYVRPGIVHRLDKETSGLMVVAKTNPMFFWLKDQFKDRRVEKRYQALVFGWPNQEQGEITAEIARKGVKQVALNTKERANSGTVSKSRKATTGFKILSKYSKDDIRFSLAEASPKTGRMHQIRVHFQHIGHPLVGDKTYANKRMLATLPLDRQFLHAGYLSFNLPNGKRVEFESELPGELKGVLDGLN